MKHRGARRRVPVGCRTRGATRADVVLVLIVVLAVLSMFFCMLLPAIQRERRHTRRLLCGKNLSEIGKAMMTYANDYNGAWPVAGGAGTVWGPGLDDWEAEIADDAFGFDANGAGGQATISSSLYLLVKYSGASPELFVCRRDKGTAPFVPERYGIAANRLRAIWDFGPDPAKHCSYAYHMPHSHFRLTRSTGPGVAVAADRNPWINGPRQEAGDFSLFKPDISPFKGTPEEARQGNAQVHRTKPHRYDGQNVLYLDGHVGFEMRAFGGFEDDNIYTGWDGADKARGVPPKPYESQPASEFDSLLVNDPPLGR